MIFPKRFSFLRFTLFPFSFIYGIIIHFRNFLFDKKILKSYSFKTPTICIGNISVGGTGKTPMTLLLLSFLHQHYKTATLSRGYKRKTKGFLIASDNSDAFELGDEPMLFHQTFSDVIVSVGEDRCHAIQQLETLSHKPNVILLDDALQHRKVKADYNILLTDYNNLYTEDYFLPVGSLRDQRSSSQRADIIVVTKCPADMPLAQKNIIEDKIKLQSHQSLFFSTIAYHTPYHLITKEPFNIADNIDKIVAIAGIANPKPFFDYIESHTKKIEKIALADHYNFSEQNIIDLFSLSENKQNFSSKFFIVTEKDAVKIRTYQHLFINLSIKIYVLPIMCVILYGQSETFRKKIIAAIDNNDN